MLEISQCLPECHLLVHLLLALGGAACVQVTRLQPAWALAKEKKSILQICGYNYMGATLESVLAAVRGTRVRNQVKQISTV